MASDSGLEIVDDEDLVRKYATQILKGLKDLQEKGFVYRDLKPNNILIDGKGRLKLTDFEFTRNLKFDESDIWLLFLRRLAVLKKSDIGSIWEGWPGWSRDQMHLDLESSRLGMRVERAGEGHFDTTIWMKKETTDLVSSAAGRESKADVHVFGGNGETSSDLGHLCSLKENKSLIFNKKQRTGNSEQEPKVSNQNHPNGGSNCDLVCDLLQSRLLRNEQSWPMDGSREYQSPTVLKTNRYSLDSDFWSLGCTIYNMFKGELLCENESFVDLSNWHFRETAQQNSPGRDSAAKWFSDLSPILSTSSKIHSVFSEMSPHAAEVMKLLLGFSRLPGGKRLKAERILEMSWFQNRPRSIVDFDSDSGPFLGNGAKLAALESSILIKKIYEKGFFYKMIRYRKNQDFVFAGTLRSFQTLSRPEKYIISTPRLKKINKITNHFQPLNKVPLDVSMLVALPINKFRNSKRSTNDNLELNSLTKPFQMKNISLEFEVRNKSRPMFTDRSEEMSKSFLSSILRHHSIGLSPNLSLTPTQIKNYLFSNRSVSQFKKSQLIPEEVDNQPKKLKSHFVPNANQQMIDSLRISRLRAEARLHTPQIVGTVPRKNRSFTHFPFTDYQAHRLKRFANEDHLHKKGKHVSDKKKNRFLTGKFGLRSKRIKRFWGKGEFACLPMIKRRSDLCSPYHGPNKFGEFDCFCHSRFYDPREEGAKRERARRTAFKSSGYVAKKMGDISRGGKIESDENESQLLLAAFKGGKFGS